MATTLLAVGRAEAQVTIARPVLSTNTKIAPAYFGPNAFPVPDMLDDGVSATLQTRLAAEYFKGSFGDHAFDALAMLRIPLFTDRANLVLWMPVEHYRLSADWKQHARIADNGKTSGTEVGTAFVSTDILLLRETTKRPAISLRAAMKTASEDDWTTARYYDTPGYFFDAAVGKELTFAHSWLRAVRLGASAGFLCWQTDNGRQNDATMYGVQVKTKFRYIDIAQDLRGYSGWEADGDRPMVAKTQIAAHFKGHKGQKNAAAPIFSPFLTYQKGIKDYPYQQFSAGLTIDFDILRKQH